MSEEEEKAAALELRELRRVRWVSLLLIPEHFDLALRALDARFQDNTPRNESRTRLESIANLLDPGSDWPQSSRDDLRSFAVVCGDTDQDGDVADKLEEAAVARLEAFASSPRDAERLTGLVGSAQKAHSDYAAAKNRFVTRNLRLVISMARRFDDGRVPLLDLVQDGNIGLMKAVDRFDPERGCRFSTYAAWWIRHSIGRSIAQKSRAVRLPNHILERRRRLARARDAFEANHGRLPTDAELAEEAKVPVGKVQQSHTLMLEQASAPIDDSGNPLWNEVMKQAMPLEVPGAAEALDGKKVNSGVASAIGHLPPIEQKILTMRFGLDDGGGLTLRAIGEQLSLSRERIRQLQEQALGRVREHLRGEGLM
jgi:RNA polymerase primary sigma factor